MCFDKEINELSWNWIDDDGCLVILRPFRKAMCNGTRFTFENLEQA